MGKIKAVGSKQLKLLPGKMTVTVPITKLGIFWENITNAFLKEYEKEKENEIRKRNYLCNTDWCDRLGS